jgi:translation initiation factor IF-2
MTAENKNLITRPPEQQREGKKRIYSLRPPVVVVLGHVDHGKTTILDFIRKTNVAEKESGGITQHIGAYEIEKDGKKITFIDTPGHEAFSAMRARGAKVADIAILVVAADEGVKTQTKEAINLVKKSDIPMIVAINKIDKSQAQPEKVKRELERNEVLVESLGGKVPSVELSAKTGQGIEGLLDLILLVAEMENLKADISQPAQGIVIETYLDEKKGPIATLILENGTLKEKQIIGTASTRGKVKNLKDFQGSSVKIAYPSQPITVLGFEKPPSVGEKIKVYKDSNQALEAIEKKERKVSSVLSVEEGKKVLNIILKADVLGSLEAVENVLKNLPQEKVILRVLKSEVGNIQETDIKLAESAKAQIFGFRVKIDPLTLNFLRQKKTKRVGVKIFEIIYELIQGVREEMEKILEPEILRKDLGEIEILALFSKRKNRQTIGGRVTEGFMEKRKKCEILREEKVIGRGKIINLQQNRKDTERVSKRNECGILFESEIKIKEGDILRIYEEERKKREL